MNPVEHRGYAASLARSFCRRFPHLQRADVEDAIQEAFIAIMSAAVSWDGDRPWLPYAKACIRRALLRWVKQTGLIAVPRDHPGLPVGSYPLDEETPEPPSDFLGVRDAISSLPQHLRAVILGLHFHDETTATLASYFGVSPRTVLNREAEAFARLREIL